MKLVDKNKKRYVNQSGSQHTSIIDHYCFSKNSVKITSIVIDQEQIACAARVKEARELAKENGVVQGVKPTVGLGRSVQAYCWTR